MEPSAPVPDVERHESLPRVGSWVLRAPVESNLDTFTFDVDRGKRSRPDEVADTSPTPQPVALVYPCALRDPMREHGCMERISWVLLLPMESGPGPDGQDVSARP